MLSTSLSVKRLFDRCRNAVRDAGRAFLGRIGEEAVLRQAVALAENELKRNPISIPTGTVLPLITFVVPVYNTPTTYLDDLLTSFLMQNQALCELVLSDDGSTRQETRDWLARHQASAGVKVVGSAQNSGIAVATNAGIAIASGQWIALLDHDDALAPHAVSVIARTLLDHPECLFLYTDEVVTDSILRPVANFLKPAWNDVLLSGVNYINHFSVYRADRLREIGGLRTGFQGSQDYDLLLRYTKGLPSEAILHLPYPAYLWRRDGASYSAQFLETATANARRALLERFGTSECAVGIGEALSADLHRVHFLPDRHQWPLVTVVIPSRDSLPLIQRVLDGLTTRTDYPALEITVVDNGSTDTAVLDLYREYEKGKVPFRADIQPAAFNFSRAVNRGIAQASGRFVLLLNNDIEIEEAGWLKEMVSCFAYQRTGIVGAKLLYPDRKLQHAGVIVGLGGLAGHWFVGQDRMHPGPMGRLRVRQALSAVTGACMLISRECLDAVGPFDEEQFAIAYNDIDFCLRALAAGYRVVWTPFSELIHHESASRGSDMTPENLPRFMAEQANLRICHRTDTLEDRAFNPWYTRDRAVPGIAKLTALPPPR